MEAPADGRSCAGTLPLVAWCHLDTASARWPGAHWPRGHGQSEAATNTPAVPCWWDRTNGGAFAALWRPVHRSAPMQRRHPDT